MQDLPSLSMDEMQQKLGHLAEGELLLDVRTPEEFASGHLAGSENIPYDQIPLHTDRLQKARSVIVYCRVGGRAQIAAQLLLQAGITQVTCINQWGMQQWTDAQRPLSR